MTTLTLSKYKIEAGTGQHIGDRQEQQDRVALFAAPRAPGYAMAVVADGMGGLSGGALAADQVLQTAKQAFDQFSPLTDRIDTMLESIVRDAHTLIKLTAMSADKRPHSTIAILVITPEHSAFWTHVGDSRLYRFSGPNCVERTTDHSYVERKIADGTLSSKAARSHSMSNVLTQALGSPDVDPQITVCHCEGLRAGDAFLLCTDGLWPYFTDAELGAALAVHAPRPASEMLLGRARERAAGKGDNCSLAIVKLVEIQPVAKNYTVEKVRHAV